MRSQRRIRGPPRPHAAHIAISLAWCAFVLGLARTSAQEAPCAGGEGEGAACSGHGACAPQGHCECQPGYDLLEDCSVSTCGEGGGCSGHGDCALGGGGVPSCSCYPGWWGATCENACAGAVGGAGGAGGGGAAMWCSGHGGCGVGFEGICCHSDGSCLCDDGWWGADCARACAGEPAEPPAPPVLQGLSSERLGTAALVVVAAPARDAAPLRALRQVLRAAGMRWTEAAAADTAAGLGDPVSGASVDLTHDGVGKFRAVFFTSPPAAGDFEVVGAYERMLGLRRVVLSSSPGVAGLATETFSQAFPAIRRVVGAGDLSMEAAGPLAQLPSMLQLLRPPQSRPTPTWPTT